MLAVQASPTLTESDLPKLGEASSRSEDISPQ